MTPLPPYLSLDRETLRLRLDPRTPEFVQDPYEAYRVLHREAPVVFWEDYGFWCVASYEGVNGLFRDRRLGRERPGGYLVHVGERPHLADFDRVEAGSLLELEAPAHTRLRGLVTRAFVSRQVERLRPRIESLAHALIDGFEGEGEADLLPRFAAPLPITVIAEMLGVPVSMGAQMLDWSHRMVTMYMHAPTPAVERDANAAAAEFAFFIREEAAAKRRNPGDDLLSLLLAARDGGDKLSEDELVSSVILILNAGHEATVHQAGNAIRTILAQGGEPGRFFANADDTERTVEEALRFDPPLHMFTRYAYQPVEIAPGITLGTNEQVGLLLGAANRDPAAFADPDRFLPDRTDGKTTAFGAGIHFCIGAPLARIELQAALSVLFERLPGLLLAEEMEFADTFHFHGFKTLRCRW